MYSDFTMVQAQTGAHIEILEMCDLDRMLRQVTEDVYKRQIGFHTCSFRQFMECRYAIFRYLFLSL